MVIAFDFDGSVRIGHHGLQAVLGEEGGEGSALASDAATIVTSDRHRPTALVVEGAHRGIEGLAGRREGGAAESCPKRTIAQDLMREVGRFEVGRRNNRRG